MHLVLRPQSIGFQLDLRDIETLEDAAVLPVESFYSPYASRGVALSIDVVFGTGEPF